MKKLITGAIAAMALLLGFAACSGEFSKDLNENAIQPLMIVGITNDPGNHVIPMTLDTPDGSEQSLEITFKDGFELTGADGKTYKLTEDYKGSWRENNGNGPMTASRFKVIPPAAIKDDGTPAWTDDYGSLNGDEVQYLKAAEDFSKIGRRGDKGVSGDPKHIVFDGVIAGESYILRAKYNSVSGALELKLDGTANNPAEMKLNIVGTSENFPAKDKDENDLSYSMKQAGSEYTYDFISVADETVEFYITNSLAGTLGGTLGTTADDLELNADSTTNFKLSAKKNVEYKITLDNSKGINKAKIKYEVISMLEKATLNANWKFSDKFYEIDAKDGSYVFKAENKNLQFTINRISGDNKLSWGAGVANSIVVDGDAIELKYTDAGDKKAPTLVSVKNLKDAFYEIKLEADDDNFILKISIEELKPVVFPENMGLQIWFNTGDNWSNNKYLKLTKEADHLYSCDVKAEGAVDDIRFDFVTGDTAPDWKDRWGVQTAGGEISLGERHGPFVNKEPANRDKLVGTAGKTYHFEIDTSAGVWCTITESD